MQDGAAHLSHVVEETLAEEPGTNPLLLVDQWEELEIGVQVRRLVRSKQNGSVRVLVVLREGLLQRTPR